MRLLYLIELSLDNGSGVPELIGLQRIQILMDSIIHSPFTLFQNGKIVSRRQGGSQVDPAAVQRFRNVGGRQGSVPDFA